MEKNINLAKILNGKPVNTKLWSPLFGDVYTSSICSEDTIIVVNHHAESSSFYNNGKYFNHAEAEPLLFPSKEMRDWRKFAWKKGDILVNKDAKVHIIFDGFDDDTYKNFHGQYYLWEEGGSIVSFEEDENYMQTSDFNKANKEDAQEYIHKIEKELGGKLNLETLEIEKSEFKDGDIVMSDSGTIVLVRGISLTRKIYYHAYMRNEYIYINQVEGEFFSRISRIKRFATDSEKQQLFDALKKEGKAWDAEKKQIVDLKPKCEFKPFDRCIWKIRNCEGSIWQASFVSYVDKYGATPMGMSIDEDLVNLIILPYNDQTKLLVGTTDEWKGGEH
jgi:hypothetical protein